jgi:hypothetical protein
MAILIANIFTLFKIPPAGRVLPGCYGIAVRCRLSALNSRRFDHSMPNAKLVKIVEESKYPEEPKQHNYHYNAIQDTLDLTLHWDVPIHQPHKQANDCKGDYNTDNWHCCFSILCTTTDKRLHA